MNRKLIAAAVGAIALVAVSLTGCSATTPASSKQITLAGVYENTQDPFWASRICGAQAEAKKLGVKLTVSSIATADNTKLSTTLDTALLTSPQGVILNPIDDTAWKAKVADLMTSGTPVVTWTESIDSELSWATSAQDGSVAGKQVSDLVSGASGSIVSLLGVADADWQHQRLDGIVKSIKAAAPGLTWLPDQIDGFDVNKGNQLISSVITAHPDLKVILSVAGPESQAVSAAVDQAGLSGKITVIAFDAVPAAVEAVKKGTIQLLISQPAYKVGAAQVQILHDYLTGSSYKAGGAIKAKAAKPVVLDLGVLTKDNIDAPASKDFIYSASC